MPSESEFSKLRVKDHSENKIIVMLSEKKVRPAVNSTTIQSLSNSVGHTCEKASFATFHEKHWAAYRFSLQNLLEKSMATVTTG